LVHRYDFSGWGSTAYDLLGGQNGSIVSTSLNNSGALNLAGSGGQYVDLPNRMLTGAGYTNITVEAFVTWHGGTHYQRVFVFGSSNVGEGPGTSGATYLSLIPSTNDGTLGARASFKGAGSTVVVEWANRLPQNSMIHVAVVFDDSNNLLKFYVAGSKVGQRALPDSLSGLNDVNNWIGRSNWSSDPLFDGLIHDFRIYSKALSDSEISASATAGPDI
jgi:hypothetical protein